MSTLPRSFVLPDLLTLVNFPFAENAHYKQAGAESAAWIDGFNMFKDRKKVEFIQSCTELLVSYFYPTASYERFRICCDFMNIVFLLDEICDEQDGDEARQTADVFVSALKDGKAAKNASPLYTLVRQFRDRFVQDASPTCQERLWKLCGSYISAVSQESDLRARGTSFDIHTYISLRREVSAVRICDCLFEYVHGIDLPDAVFNDPSFTAMYWANVDMIGLANDIYSYKMEQSKGLDASNLVTILMREKGYSLQESVDHIGAQFKSLLDDFNKNEATLPSFGPKADRDLEKYIFTTKQSIIGYMVWCFDTHRYFGPGDGDVRHTLVVQLAEDFRDKFVPRANTVQAH